MIEKDPARRLKTSIENLNIHTDDKRQHTSENKFTEQRDLIRNSPAELAIEEMHPTLKMQDIPDRTANDFESGIMGNSQKKQPLTTNRNRNKDLRFEDPQEFLIKRCRGLEGALEEIKRLPKRQLD